MATMTRTAEDKRTERRDDAFGELVHWQTENSSASNAGWAKDLSRSGMSFMTSNEHVPGLGAHLNVHRERTSSSDDYQVVRVTTISKRLSLVGCSIASRAVKKRWWSGEVNDVTFGDGYEVLARVPQQSGSLELTHERSRDRRDCQRWMTNRAVQWKVIDESRIGAGYIVERSLRGLAIRTSQRDACHIGAQIEWSNKTTQQWLGFQRAIVRRRKRTAEGRYVIYLERTD